MYADHLDLHVLTHAFPTRRSSDLVPPCIHSSRGNAGRVRLSSPRTPELWGTGGGSEGRRRKSAWVAASSRTALRSVRPTASGARPRSEEHTSELQSLMRISYAVFCLKKKNRG